MSQALRFVLRHGRITFPRQKLQQRGNMDRVPAVVLARVYCGDEIRKRLDLFFVLIAR